MNLLHTVALNGPIFSLHENQQARHSAWHPTCLHHACLKPVHTRGSSHLLLVLDFTVTKSSSPEGCISSSTFGDVCNPSLALRNTVFMLTFSSHYKCWLTTMTYNKEVLASFTWEDQSSRGFSAGLLDLSPVTSAAKGLSTGRQQETPAMQISPDVPRQLQNPQDPECDP